MLIAVVSDTHGYFTPAEKVLRRFRPELLFFLGDFYADGEKLLSKLEIPGYLVAGNGDRSSQYPQEDKLITIAGVRFFLTHGHNLGVKQGMTRLEAESRKNLAQVTLYGHTHCCYLRQHENCWLMNPGSASEPRDLNEPSVGLIEIGAKQVEFSIISVVDQSLIDGNVWRLEQNN